MNTLITVILIVIMFSGVGAIDLGLLAVNDTLTFPVFCFDTLGRENYPADSNHVIVWYGAEGANDYTYSQRDVTGGANPAWIDSVNLYGVNSYYFMDLVDDIDSNRSNGSYSGKVVTWKQGESTPNPFTFTKVGDATAAGDNILNHFIVDPIADANIVAIDAGAIKTASFASGAINATVIGDRAFTLAKFDSAALAALYLGGIWLDAGAANTDSDVGVDGTPSNPVSTVAAARILADSMGLQKYYIRNSSSFTLDATYENWEFIGIAEGSLINFGSQDVDNSHFEHLMISGTQGGTGIVGLHDCYLNAIDSLEAIVTNSSFSDTISIRVSTNTVFDQCYSNIAGNNTPALDFDSTGVIEISLRHYSGGLTILNGSPNQTMSFEAFGQLIIDTTCTSVNVTARGVMTITNSGTTTALTDAGVVNNNRLKNIISVVESQRMGHTHQTTGNIFYVDPTNGDTHANGNRGGIDDPYAGVQDCHDNAVTDSNHDLIILLAGAASSTDTLIEAVTLSKRYLFIRGPGRDFIWTRSGNGNTITITADGIELSGFQLETATTGTGNGIDLTDADFLKVHSVWINATQGDGINILRGDNSQICCNHFNGTGVSGAGQGIDIVGTAGTSNGNVIEDNIFRDAAGDAIQISGGTTINTTIKNNVIEGSTAWGIDIGASSVDAFVTDNRFGNNSSGSINDNGTTTILLNNEQWGTVATIAGYPPYTYKMVAIAGATTTQFAVDLASILDGEGNPPDTPGDNFSLGMAVQAKGGNSESYAVTIADFTIADSTFTVRPGLPSAFTAGDTIFIRPWRGAVEPNPWTNHEIVVSGTGRVTVDTVESRVVARVDSLDDDIITDAKFATGAITAASVAAGAWLESKNYVWANMDTATFPTDSSDFVQYLIDRFTSSVSLPDSLLEMIAVVDSIKWKVDTLQIWVGKDGQSTALVSLHMKTGTYDGTAGNNIEDNLDTLQTWIGKDGQSTSDVSVHMKLGAYSGATGDNNNVKDDIAALTLTGGGTEPETLIVLSTDDSTQIQGARVVVRTIDQSTVKVDGLITDVNGKLILDLDADSFFIAVTANNYTQTLDTIVVASGGQTDTLFMVLFDPGSPAGDLTRVYGRVQTGDVGIKGVDITAEIPDEYWPVRFGTAVIVARRDTTTDSSGDWAIDLEANTDLTTIGEFMSDSTSYWIIEGTIKGEELFRYKVRVADDSTSQLAVPNVD